jgi:hypothetical protein
MCAFVGIPLGVSLVEEFARIIYMLGINVYCPTLLYLTIFFVVLESRKAYSSAFSCIHFLDKVLDTGCAVGPGYFMLESLLS